MESMPLLDVIQHVWSLTSSSSDGYIFCTRNLLYIEPNSLVYNSELRDYELCELFYFTAKFQFLLKYLLWFQLRWCLLMIFMLWDGIDWKVRMLNSTWTRNIRLRFKQGRINPGGRPSTVWLVEVNRATSTSPDKQKKVALVGGGP